MREAILALLMLASILCLGLMPAAYAEKTITDMEGRTVTISEPPERVITVGYSFSPCVMAAFGVGDKIIASGGNFVTDQTGLGSESPGTILLPDLREKPNLGWGPDINVEAVVALDPDLIILEKDCAGQGDRVEGFDKVIDQLQLFNKSFSLVVIKSAACYTPPTPDSMYTEIELLGEIFDNQDKAMEMTDFLKEEVDMVRERTEGIAEDEKPSVLMTAFFSANTTTTTKLALVLPDYDCSALYPDITNIKNIHTGPRVTMSAEQLIALDPDVIVTGGAQWLPALYEDEAMQSITAFKNKRVYSIGRLELARNMAGLEFPIEMLIEAKAAYPDRFEDVNVGEQFTKHLKTIYGLNDEQAQEFKKQMYLDWMDEEGF